GRTVLTVFAAASLADALAATESYRSATDTTIVLSTDSSTTLRTQIEQGAAADAFLGADTANPDTLAAAALAAYRTRPVCRARVLPAPEPPARRPTPRGRGRRPRGRPPPPP